VTVPTLNEFIDPRGKGRWRQNALDDDIVAEVRREEAVKHGEVIEVDSDDETDDNEEGNLTSAEMMSLCQQLERASLISLAECALDVATTLRRFRAQLLKMGLETAK
jgi:hypothetical protein